MISAVRIFRRPSRMSEKAGGPFVGEDRPGTGDGLHAGPAGLLQRPQSGPAVPRMKHPCQH